MLTIMVLAGCRQPIAENVTQYILEPHRAAEPVPVSEGRILEVRRFTIDSAFAGKNLVYRTGELKYEADFYNEFLISPATMVREAARDWLAQSNRFLRVADPGIYSEPALALEANITALYGDMRDKNAPKAVMEIRAFLLKVEGVEDPEILFGKTYSAAQDLEKPAPDGLIAGLNSCLQTILDEMEQDLAARL
jgi:hypothetical protein